MFLKYPIPLALLLLVCLSSRAQLPLPYNFQKDDTVLKKVYYDQSIKKKDLMLRSSAQYAADYKKIYEDQFEDIIDLWQSTRVVTAPGANDYLQAVVKKIVAANKELSGTDARVVFSRDWWPNAYSMGDGSIVINAGLMIFLANEAELVFVLSHELAHYYLDHTGKAIKKYVETINSKAYQEELKRIAKTEFRVNQQLEQLSKSFIFNTRRHKREHEAEADRMAFNFMKNTGYDCQAIGTCLQLLDKVDDSLLYKPLDLQKVFHSAQYPFKEKWIKKTSAIFSQLNEEDSPLSVKEKDSLKTHPDCQKRIALLADSLKAVAGKGSSYLVNENKFLGLKTDFLIEMTAQCYRENQLSRHLYYSLLLQQLDEYRPLAVYETARCLNELYDRQKNHKLGLAIDTEGKGYPDNYNLLLRMLSRLRLEEIANINYYFCKQHEVQMKDYPGFRKEMDKAQLLNK